MLSNKYLLILSGLFSGALLLLNMIGTFNICGATEYGSCMDTVYNLMLSFSPVIPLFAFTVVSSFVLKNTYRVWFDFAKWWTPLSIITIFLAPQYASDWMFPIEKGTVAVFMMGIFFVVSTIIIARSYFKR